MQRPSVDLPQPDSPTSPSVSPCASSRSTPSTARSTAASAAVQPPADARRGARSASRARAPRAAAQAPAITGSLRHVLGGDARDGCTRSRGSPPSGRSGNSPLDAVVAARTGSADGSGSPAAARRGRAARPGSSRARPRTSSTSGTERSRPSVYGCRGSRKTASTVPVSTTWPAYITATRLAGLRDHREVVRDEDEADAELARAATRAASGSDPGS